MPDSPKKNNQNRKWILLIVAPFITLFTVMILQVITTFVFTGSPNSNGEPILTVVRIISLIAGVISVILLLLIPVWIIMLVKSNSTGGRSKAIAVALAIVFGLFAWLYTYDIDKTKFWVNLGVSIVTLGAWSAVAWIWSIVDTLSRPDEFYTQYQNDTAKSAIPS